MSVLRSFSFASFFTPTVNLWCRCLVVLSVVAVLFGGSISAAASDLPAELTLSGQAGHTQTLILNGKGYRKKAFIKLYEAGLYAVKPTNNAKLHLESDKAAAIKIVIVSGLITQEKMQSAIKEGFENSLKGNTDNLRNEIAQFLAVFNEGVTEDDIFTLAYTPQLGTRVTKNGELKTTIAGLLFKQGLFGIWLSDKPADKRLKKAMLGR